MLIDSLLTSTTSFIVTHQYKYQSKFPQLHNKSNNNSFFNHKNMGRNSKSSTPNTPFCEKLLKAFGISHRPKINKLSPSTSHHEQQHQQQNNSSQHIYVHHEPAIMEIKTHSSKSNKYGGGDEDSVNDVFSNYINRAKRRLGNIASKKHSNNDSSGKGKENSLKAEDRRFSDYIARARDKLRATSSSVGLTKTKSSSVK